MYLVIIPRAGPSSLIEFHSMDNNQFLPASWMFGFSIKCITLQSVEFPGVSFLLIIFVKVLLITGFRQTVKKQCTEMYKGKLLLQQLLFLLYVLLYLQLYLQEGFMAFILLLMNKSFTFRR